MGNTYAFFVVGQAKDSGVQKELCRLTKYASDGVEGLEWTVEALGSRGRYHQGDLQLLGNTLGFADSEGKSCALSFEFTGSPESGDLAVRYVIHRFKGPESVLEEKGLVLFGADTLYKASRGELFKYIQTPD